MDDETRWYDDDYLHCSFCGRSRGQSAKLIAGPGVYICDGCVTLARGWPGVQDPVRRCDFCGRSPGAVPRLVAQAGTAVCSECLDLCDEIIAEEQAG